MKWYWTISCSNTVDNPLVADRGSLEEFDEWSFICNGRIDYWPRTAWVMAGTPDEDGDPDDVLQTCFALPIYSLRLQKCLIESGIEDIQFLPLAVSQSDGTPVTGFSIANILSCRDALDEGKSKLTRYQEDWLDPEQRGHISGIMKATLIGAVLEGYDIIRLSSFGSPVYVSARFKQLFERNRFTGYDFVEVKVI